MGFINEYIFVSLYCYNICILYRLYFYCFEIKVLDFYLKNIFYLYLIDKKLFFIRSF